MDSKKTILVVEDEDSLIKALAKKLTDGGYEVLQAMDGEEGLRLAVENHPDLILLDILMPTKDGMVMLEEVRETKWGSTVPVIILTNLNHAESVKRAKYRGVEDYLIKADFELEEVLLKIQERLESAPNEKQDNE